jgi:hypothetical protein
MMLLIISHRQNLLVFTRIVSSGSQHKFDVADLEGGAYERVRWTRRMFSGTPMLS